MPYFYSEAEVEIDVDEFLSACKQHEIEEIIEVLIEDGCIHPSANKGNSTSQSVSEWEFNNIINKIASNHLQLTNEEDELLKKIASRF